MSKTILSLALMASMAAGAMAQTAQKPVMRHIPWAEDKSHVMGVSDNGLWALASTSGEDGNTRNPRLLDVANGKFIDLFTQSNSLGNAADATDDGKIVAGSWQGNPALYYTDSKKWENLPMPNRQFNYGTVSAITPDGKFAIGYAYTTVGDNNFVELPLAWDLSGATPVSYELTNMPDFDLAGDAASMVRLTALTSDGRYAAGTVDYSYPMTSWSFIYDLKEQTWKPLGYEYDGTSLSMGEQGILVDGLVFSPDGKHAAASIYTDEGGEMGYYDIATGKVTIIPGSQGKMLDAIDNFGVVYASAPSLPMRDWYFYADGYWYDWKNAALQLWGVNWQNDVTKDDYGFSGSFVGASSDGLRLLSADYSGMPGGSYAVTLTKPLSELAVDLDPLYNHMAYPMEGSSFSAVRNITVYFDRDIEVIGARDCVKLLDENGEEVKSSISVALEAGQTRNLLVTFRNAEMEAGKTYTVLIPAGTVQVKGDATHANKEIRLSYKGRANEAVKPVKISPESGTAMPRLNMTTNPVSVTFDAVLSVLEGGAVNLYRVTGGEDEFLYSLSSNVNGSEMVIFPAAEQQLAKDVTYKVVIEANTVGDIAGNNGNEKIEITYIGTYENKVPVVDGVVYSENFDLGVANMLLYDGDQRTPSDLMANWGFTSVYPWWYVRDSEESMDQSAASHSMYNPVGQSDDWMVTPRMYIPDETCSLTFDSQSFRKTKEDYLKVYILATDDVYTAPITKAFVDRIKAEGKLVYNEKQNPGESEDLLAGDWTHNVVKLGDFARKNIYIAFVNDNDNQSAVFLDNVLVQQDMAFTVGVDMPDFVVDAASVPVKAVFTVMGEETYSDLTLRLLDAEDKVVDEKAFSGLALKKGDSQACTFDKQLPLAKGRVNEYAVEAVVGDKSVTMPRTIKNLRFQPERTMVIEEGTGTQCGYCPLGHRALELIDDIYGEKVIPVAVHSYTGGSEFLTSWTQDYGAFLGFTGYPAAMINREFVGEPLYSDGKEYYTNSPAGDKTWCDYLSKAMGELTDAEIHIDHATIDTNNGMIEVGVDVRYAYDSDNVNLNLHTVVLENGLTARQANNVSTIKSDLLGDWGSGGKYGRPSVGNVPFNHVARGMHGTSYAGVTGMFPRTIDSSKTYKSEYAFQTPRELTDANNAEVVVMLIDANSQRVINAAKAPCLVGVVGIDQIVGGTENNTGDVYSITGIKVLENATIDDVNRLEKGIYIFNGKKVMVR